MTRDEQLIKAALEMAAGMIEESAKDAMEAADTSDMGSIVATWLNDEAEAIRAIAPAEVLAKVGSNEPERPVKPKPKQMMCGRCDGSGYVWAAGNCPACGGDGWITAPQPAEPDIRKATEAMVDAAFRALPADAHGTIGSGEMYRVLNAALAADGADHDGRVIQ